MSPALRRTWNVVRKEWEVLLGTWNGVLLATLMPALVVAQALVVIWAISHFAGETLAATEVLRTALAKMAGSLPGTGGLPVQEQLQVLFLYQFNFYLLLVPCIVAISLATFSIVEEKQARTLEPLLATPVSTWELLLGKALSGGVPALLAAWASEGMVLLGVTLLGWGHLIQYVVTPSWLVSLLLLVPGVTGLSFILGVVGSSRASDARSAQNISVVIILPVLALVGIQVTGRVWFGWPAMLALALGLIAVDLVLLRVAVRLFQREAIVVQWR